MLLRFEQETDFHTKGNHTNVLEMKIDKNVVKLKMSNPENEIEMQFTQDGLHELIGSLLWMQSKLKSGKRG